MHPKRIIKNYSQLAKSKLRKDALAILEAGYKAIDTKQAVRCSVSLTGEVLKIQNRRYDLKKFDHIYVIGIGKASFDAAQALEQILGSRINGGMVLDVKGGKLKRIDSVKGTHPLPSEKNVRATKKIIDLLQGLDHNDLVITIISGGGSALLCQPYQMRCGELVLITRALIKSGATIDEINTVRKHLSMIQGGQFARMAHPATIAALIFSDVPGDDLSVIASGPTVMDNTSVKDAAKVLAKYKIMKACAMPGCDLTETPKDPVYFKKVRNFLIVCNRIAVKAMNAEARKRGYSSRVYSTRLEGEARRVGQDLVRAVRAGEALIAAGETTVIVKGNGKGGRNQELVLGALEKLPENVLVSSVASDGIDNTPAAGAIGDQLVLDLIAKKRLDPKAALKNNDAYTIFAKTNNQIKTGITGANVSDLMLVLRKAK
ncbi:MAG: DUF4147 domain-containing protein [Candidatus Uhrbacteria bacterium]|nr:DUF4147 domain-containing protein [Patescibacteria group bacterium]MBU1907037.1 DUF4147 domain-containing protein [Patescibacteria group bacterium]